MGFKLAPSDTIKHKVELDIPTDMGRTYKTSIVVTYKRVSHDEVMELSSQCSADGFTGQFSLIRPHIDQIEGIRDDKDSPVLISDELLDACESNLQYNMGIVSGFFEAQGGNKVARAMRQTKN